MVGCSTFCKVFGLRINKSKSEIVGIHSNEEKVLNVANTLGCEVGCWHLKYLGLPLGGNPKSINFWNLVVEKIQFKLQGWKRAFLFKGGKLTLIKSVLSNLLVYFLFALKFLLK